MRPNFPKTLLNLLGVEHETEQTGKTKQWVATVLPDKTLFYSGEPLLANHADITYYISKPTKQYYKPCIG